MSAAELTNCICQQLEIAAELTAAKQTLCIWNKLTYSTWSWQTTEELIVYRLADRLHSSWQSAVELTGCGWADRLWLIERVSAQLRVCIWAELTHCSCSLATVGRGELTAEAYSMLMSPMNAVVLTTARQKQWLIHCQFQSFMWMWTPETYLCGLWQATACRSELTAELI